MKIKYLNLFSKKWTILNFNITLSLNIIRFIIHLTFIYYFWLLSFIENTFLEIIYLIISGGKKVGIFFLSNEKLCLFYIKISVNKQKYNLKILFKYQIKLKIQIYYYCYNFYIFCKRKKNVKTTLNKSCMI